MKVTLDLDKLLKEGKISAEEHDKLTRLGERKIGMLAYNALVGFGVIAVSTGVLALVPSFKLALLLGFGMMLTGGGLLRQLPDSQWLPLAHILLLIGALMFGGGIIGAGEGDITAFLTITAVFAVVGGMARSGLLAALAVLSLSASIGAWTAYGHAMYVLGIPEPTLTIVLFGGLAIGLYHLAKILPADFERLAIIASRTSLFLVNFGFWIGSLWGDRDSQMQIIISDETFSFLWAIALITTAMWAWQKNKTWVFNTTMVFAGIHFYTQWFERLEASPATVLAAGLLLLVFAFILRRLNLQMAEQQKLNEIPPADRNDGS